MRKNVYKVLIAIFIIILIGTLIYFYIKYNKYMISNTQYNILSSEITYDDEQIFADGSTKMAKSFQELLDIEESSDKVKKAFSTLQVNDKPINQYFNEEFFNYKNVIVFFDTVWRELPDITIIKEENIANIYYYGRGGATPCKYVRFIVVDKDIEDFKIEHNKFTKKYLILQEILIEGTILIGIIIFIFRIRNKVSTKVVIIFTTLVVWILSGIVYVRWIY